MSSKILSAFALAAFVAGLVAGCGDDGGGGGQKLIDLLPASGEVTGWTEDTEKGEPGPQVTQSADDATAWVDGAMDKFVESGGWVALGQEFYTNDDLDISLYIHEWTDAASAAVGYTDLEEYHADDIPSWTDVSLGAGETACRTGRVGTFYWYLNGTKSKYLIETTTGPASDENSEQAAQDFAAAVFNKIK